MKQKTSVAPARVASLVLATAFAVTGTCAFGVQSASATKGDPHKVWVCKYVGKPGEDERLKGGKNPIHVDLAALTNDKGVLPQVGDLFSDGQVRSVVISIDVEVGTAECPAVSADIEVEAVQVPSGTSATEAPAETPAPVVDAPQAPAPQQAPAATVSGANAGVPQLGGGAPNTGGTGLVSQPTGNVVAGGVLLAAAGGLLAAAARRRRCAVKAD